jgi:hypothetical protein
MEYFTMERWISLILALLLAPHVAVAQSGSTGESQHREFIRGVSEDIAKLKERYPQLQEFSPAEHADIAQLKMSYGYRTHGAERGGGWSGAVPNPNPDGIWFYIDLHDPDSKAQIHTQPVPNSYGRLGDKSVRGAQSSPHPPRLPNE